MIIIQLNHRLLFYTMILIIYSKKLLAAFFGVENCMMNNNAELSPDRFISECKNISSVLFCSFDWFNVSHGTVTAWFHYFIFA